MPFNLCDNDPFLFFVQLFHRVKIFETIELGSSCNDSWGFLRSLVLEFVHLTRLQSLSRICIPFHLQCSDRYSAATALLFPSKSKSSGTRSRPMGLATTFDFLAL
ncbi:hypothetical protein IGI04_001499, partial [Brassica rapa subsp. trilocularis]